MLLAEFGDRPIVRGRAGGQPPKRHIIDASAFDHPRRPHSGGVGVQQERPSAADRRAAHRAPRCTQPECAQDPNARRPTRQRAGPGAPPASGHSAPAPPTIDDRAEHTERLVRRATSASPSWASARCPRPTLNNSSSAGSSAAHHSALRPSTPSPRPACCRLRLALSSDTCQRSMTDRPALRYFRCRHELLAVGPAWGYDKATGRSQIVFLPTSPGMQNGSPGLHTATGTHPDHCAVARHPPLVVYLVGPARNAEAVVKWRNAPAPLRTRARTPSRQPLISSARHDPARQASTAATDFVPASRPVPRAARGSAPRRDLRRRDRHPDVAR